MPTQIGVGGQGVWSPFFVQNGAAFGANTHSNMGTEQANMTYVPHATLAHPYYHATTNPNAHWMKIDMNTTGITTVGGTGDVDFVATAPDATRRWGHVIRFLFYKDGNLTSTGQMLSDASPFMYMDTEGYLISAPSVNAGVYRSIAALASNAPMVIEVWYIPKDSTGANLLGRTGFAAVQVVVRVDTNPGGTPALTTILNVLAEGVGAVSAVHPGPLDVGDTSTRGAVNFYYSNIYGPNWEDADAPYGAVRVEEYIPRADYDSGFTTGSYADWDEAAPDDGTTVISQGTYAASANELSETTANGGATGTSTAATTGPPGTMTDGAAAWVVNALTGYIVTSGGKTMTIASNTATVITGTAGWSGGGNPGAATYTVAPSAITGSDAVICMSTVTRAVQLAADSKGATVVFYAAIHDGTTLLKKASSPNLTNYQYRTRFWRTDASAAAWAQAALANIKIGARYDTVVGDPLNIFNRSFSACRGYIAWVKSGEEYAAVPAIVRSDPPFPRRPIRNFLVTR